MLVYAQHIKVNHIPNKPYKKNMKKKKLQAEGLRLAIWLPPTPKDKEMKMNISVIVNKCESFSINNNTKNKSGKCKRKQLKQIKGLYLTDYTGVHFFIQLKLQITYLAYSLMICLLCILMLFDEILVNGVVTLRYFVWATFSYFDFI